MSPKSAAEKAAWAAYMSRWAKKNRARLRTARQKKIAALLATGVSGTRPCTGCGTPLDVTPYRLVNRQWRCYACYQFWGKEGRKARYEARYPQKKIAHRALNYAVRLGRVVRLPCELCGNVKSQAHHDDYSKPLEVHWLCRQCHWTEHFPHRKKAR